MQGGQRATEAETDAPVLPVMVAIWSQVFERELGPDDDFFLDLDGNSMAALQVVSLVEDELGAEVTVSDLFQGSTPALLAAVVEGQRAEGG